MNCRAYKLTPDVQRSITAFVTAGGFPHVAVEAAGIPAEVFHRWMVAPYPEARAALADALAGGTPIGPARASGAA